MWGGWTGEAWAWTVLTAEWVIRIGALFYLPRKRSPAVARSWLLLVFFFPWLGVALYAIVGRNAHTRDRRAQIEAFSRRLRPVEARLREAEGGFSPQVSAALAPIELLARNLGQFGITDGNRVDVIADSQKLVDRLVADIDQAADHVHLQFYIVAVDLSFERVFSAMERAAARGVRCALLADAIGSGPWLSDLAKRCRAGGVDFQEALPVRLFSGRGPRVDLRNHRKIAVIDGVVGYTGSMNLIREALGPGLRYEDLMVRVQGPVVLQLQMVFVLDWYLESGQALVSEKVFPSPTPIGTVAAQILPSGPGSPVGTNQRFFVSLIHQARRRVVITSPYFIPDESLLQALETAVLRGVAVDLFVGQEPGQIFVTLAQRSYYGILLRAGIRVHRYRPDFLHAKHMLIDDDLTVIGSSNMDVRSFLLNEEVSLVFFDREVNERVSGVVDRYKALCDDVQIEAWQRRHVGHKTLEHLARLFGPLL